MPNPEGEFKLSDRKIKSILGDAEKSARAFDLVHVDDKQPGIKRVKVGDTFDYFIGKKKIRKKSELERIRKLVIPPAWEEVWICRLENGHLQATGKDTRQRKQYKYHPLWDSLRNQTKFYRLHEFGKALPKIRAQLAKDLSRPGLPAEKVLAAVVSLMEQTSIRIGNSAYEKLYGSFGLTTLKDKHVKITGANMRFMFKGKKGIAHNISLKNKRLARIVKNCRDIPGKELFQYYDDDGNHKSIDSGMVNAYLKSITGKDFTAKDFRTWSGTVRAISAFKEVESSFKETESSFKEIEPSGKEIEPSVKKIDPSLKKNEIKKNMVMVLDSVAEHLGNTRTVCKKYYVHPIILDLYENSRLQKYLSNIDDLALEQTPYSQTEQLLLTILEKERLA